MSALGVEEQRVRVILDLPTDASTKGALGDNYRVEVHIVAWQAEAALRVPSAAVFRRGDDWMVYVIEGGRAGARRIEVGEQAADVVEVKGGVAAGTQVILRPGEALRDGARVSATAESP